MTLGKSERRTRIWRVLGVGLVILAGMLPLPGHAASWSSNHLLMLSRALAFLVPPPGAEDGSNAAIGIAYAANNPASRQDAEAIVGLIGAGLRAGDVTLKPRLIEAGAVATSGVRVVIAAIGAASPQLVAEAQAAHALCVTADVAAVQAALCTMAITTEPKPVITLNHAVSAASGIQFATAFRMMIREI